MLANLALGTLVISANVLIHTFGLVLLSRAMSYIIRWFRLHRHSFGKTVAMVTTVLGLFAVHTVEIWLWAGTYLTLGAVHSLEDALYFSIVTFSTVGYGDITLDAKWRLLASLE